MPAHDLSAFYRGLKRGTLAPAYYFYGPEDVLKDEAVAALLEQVLDPTLREFNLDQLSAGQIAPEQLADRCAALPLLAERRVMVVRDVEAWKRRTKSRQVVLDYLSHPSPDIVLIMVQGAGAEKPDAELSRRAYAVVFDPLSTAQTRRWVEHRAKMLEVSMAPEAVHHLVDAVGTDLAALLAELSKVSAIAADRTVTVPMMEGLVGVRSGETALDWRNAVLDGETTKALALLPQVLSQPGVTGVRLVTALGAALIGIGIAREQYDRGARGQALQRGVFNRLRAIRPFGIPDWKEETKRWTAWATAWPPARLSAGLAAALEADRALKSTRLSGEAGVVADLVLQLHAVPQGAS